MYKIVVGYDSIIEEWLWQCWISMPQFRFLAPGIFLGLHCTHSLPRSGCYIGHSIARQVSLSTHFYNKPKFKNLEFENIGFQIQIKI